MLFEIKFILILVEVVVELVVAELVEALKRPQERANADGGFDKLSHRNLPILKIDFRAVKATYS